MFEILELADGQNGVHPEGNNFKDHSREADSMRDSFEVLKFGVAEDKSGDLILRAGDSESAAGVIA
jgi:DNA repair exonuclease SbcCD nuclease subunit